MGIMWWFVMICFSLIIGAIFGIDSYFEEKRKENEKLKQKIHKENLETDIKHYQTVSEFHKTLDEVFRKISNIDSILEKEIKKFNEKLEHYRKYNL